MYTPVAELLVNSKRCKVANRKQNFPVGIYNN